MWRLLPAHLWARDREDGEDGEDGGDIYVEVNRAALGGVLGLLIGFLAGAGFAAALGMA